jgi:hypothetical protein
MKMESIGQYLLNIFLWGIVFLFWVMMFGFFIENPIVMTCLAILVFVANKERA